MSRVHRGVLAALVLCVLAAGLAAQAAPVVPPQDAVVEALLAPDRAENARLAAELSEPDGRLAQVKKQLSDLDARLTVLRQDRQRVEQRVAAAGSTESVGQMLWRERGQVPEPGSVAHGLERLQQQVRELELRLLEISDQRAALDDLDTVLAERERLLPAGLSADDRAAAVAGLRALLTQRIELLARIAAAGDAVSGVLLDCEQAQRDLATEALEFRDYLDTHVMWLHSATPLNTDDLPRLVTDGGAALRWLVLPAQWQGLLRVLLDDARDHLVPFLLCAAAFGVLLRVRPRLRARIEADADHAFRPRGDSFRYTLDCALCTLLMSVPWPALAWAVAKRLARAEHAGPFEHAIGAGLQITAVYGLALTFGRRLCRPRGLGEAHFRWSPPVTASLRRGLRVLTAGWLPPIFLLATFAAHGNDAWSESLGRGAFVVSGVVLAIVFWRLLRPGGAVMRAFHARQHLTWWWSLSGVGRLAIVGAPLCYVGLSLGGYYYTALALQQRVQATLLLCVATGVVYALLMRWLYVVRVHLLADKRRLRQVAAQAEQEGQLQGQLVAANAADFDVSLVNEQTRKLVGAALVGLLCLATWLLWVDMLPAFSVLNEVTLWQHASTESLPMLGADGKALLDAEGKPQLGVVSVQKPVTLLNLLVAAFICVAFIVAVRNVAGLLEMSMLRRLPFSASGRYAVRALTQYAIVLAGVVGVFSALGVAWGDVQWLAAAVTVGLGFGMQEIFANFVAGVIVLLERPIRVGDTVTVDGVSGSVTRIRMRATTITDPDQRELLVPNKQFITGKVVNWTLSDKVLRVVLKVGVAYGSDTAQVCSLLLRLARENPLVLSRPEPLAYFDSFGDSALNFELRVFVETPERFRDARHQLNLAIDAAFREAGINIAFPQRDIHVRSLPPEWSPARKT